MDPSSEAVPYELVMTGGQSRHDEPSITVYRSLPPWREHWAGHHHTSCPFPACPEPDLHRRMLIEITAGRTTTGMAEFEVTTVEISHANLVVQATLHYPTGPATADIGNPFAVLTTPLFKGNVTLDLSVLHGIQRLAPRARQ